MSLSTFYLLSLQKSDFPKSIWSNIPESTIYNMELLSRDKHLRFRSMTELLSLTNFVFKPEYPSDDSEDPVGPPEIFLQPMDQLLAAAMPTLPALRMSSLERMNSLLPLWLV